MAVDKPLHLFSNTRALRLSHFTDQTKYVDFVTTSAGGLTVTPFVAAQTISLANTAALSVGGTLAVTGASTLTGTALGVAGFAANGQNLNTYTAAISLDYAGGNSRIFAWGPDATTRGGLIIYVIESDAGNAIAAVTISNVGAVSFAAAVTAATTLTATGAFGCNTKAAQTAYASGGALNAYGAGANGFDTGANASALHAMVVSIRAALVANGIMS